jgi:sensor domain CHASE-containing protein
MRSDRSLLVFFIITMMIFALSLSFSLAGGVVIIASERDEKSLIHREEKRIHTLCIKLVFSLVVLR